MEIGSGSGATSVVVMEALADYAERVELTYTDISPQLVAYGRRTYGKQYPFVRFHILDVEKDVVPQVELLLCHNPHIISSTLLSSRGIDPPLEDDVWISCGYSCCM